ncbi:MAG: GntR family transcriptional regulator [Eubacterium sp.]
MDYIKINKFSLVPLYSQLKESIKSAIQNGILKPGDKLPTEYEICDKFSLSRTVTRQAFYELMNEGYICRFKSRGTFVSQQNQTNVFFKQIMSFNDEMRLYGYEPKTELLSLEEVSCSDSISQKSGIPLGEPLIRIQRLRYRDNVPIVYVDAYYRADRIRGIENYDIEKNSLYDTLEKYYGIKVMHTKKQFMAKTVEDKHAEYLMIKKKSAVQYVESLEYDEEDTLLSFDISVYAGERNVFEVEINNLPKNSL